MTGKQTPPVQQQLRRPFCKRTLRFTQEGFNALQGYKERLQQALQRPVSDSVALDKLIAAAVLQASVALNVNHSG